MIHTDYQIQAIIYGNGSDTMISKEDTMTYTKPNTDNDLSIVPMEDIVVRARKMAVKK
jgi:hypothetical protein